MTPSICPIACPIASLSKMRTTWMSAGSAASRARSAVHLCTSFPLPAARLGWTSLSAGIRPRGQQRRLKHLGDLSKVGASNQFLQGDRERLSARLAEIAVSFTFFLFITGAEANGIGGRP